MAVEKIGYTSREFRTFVNLPENLGKIFERIDGEVVEVMPSGIYASVVANLISRAITNHVIEHHLGYVSGEQGGYDVSDEDTFAPDVAFILKARQPTLPKEGYNPIPPDFVVEVVSPSERYYHQRRRAPKTLLERSLQMVKALRHWLPEGELVVVGDNTYAALDFLAAAQQLQVTVIARLRLDAALYEPAPPYNKRGRPRKKGKRLPTLAAVLDCTSEVRWLLCLGSTMQGYPEQEIREHREISALARQHSADFDRRSDA